MLGLLMRRELMTVVTARQNARTLKPLEFVYLSALTVCSVLLETTTLYKSGKGLSVLLKISGVRFILKTSAVEFTTQDLSVRLKTGGGRCQELNHGLKTRGISLQMRTSGLK